MTVIRIVWNNQSRMAWPLCLQHFHFRSFGSAGEMSCCFCARHTGTDQDGKQEQSQTTKDFEHFEHCDIPELRELLSKKGLKTLHQNNTGLLGKKSRICKILDAFKNVGIFLLVKRNCPVLMRLRHRLMGSTVFVGKSRTLGQGGAVGASNISSRILIAT